MNNLEKEYRFIKSIMKAPSELIQKAYDLQAKSECACENGDPKAQRFFTRKLNDLIQDNPSLKEHMSHLADYFGV